MKGRTGYSKNLNGDAVGTPTIPNDEIYNFSDSAGGADSVMSENIFKRDPGIAGLVLHANGDPAAATAVKIYDAKGVLRATLATDADGWYQWSLKYSGKTVTYTIKLPAYNLAQSITIRSTKLVIINFNVA